MSDDPVRIVEDAAENIGLKFLLDRAVDAVFVAVPWLATPPLGWIFSQIVHYLGNQMGHAAIIKLGNVFIQFNEAHHAALATEEAKALQKVNANPAATQKEKDDANKKFDDAYANLIHFRKL